MSDPVGIKGALGILLTRARDESLTPEDRALALREAGLFVEHAMPEDQNMANAERFESMSPRERAVFFANGGKLIV